MTKILFYYIRFIYFCEYGYTYFLMTNKSTRHTLTINAAIIGPTTHTIPGSSPLVFTETSGFPSKGVFGFGRRGSSPGGTSLISKDRYSENGDDVYKC